MQAERMLSLTPVGVTVPLWPWLLWTLWKSRNKLCFDDRSFTRTEVVHKAIKDAKEWQEAQTSQAKRPTAPPSSSTPQWRSQQKRKHRPDVPCGCILVFGLWIMRSWRHLQRSYSSTPSHHPVQPALYHNGSCGEMPSHSFCGHDGCLVKHTFTHCVLGFSSPHQYAEDKRVSTFTIWDHGWHLSF